MMAPALGNARAIILSRIGPPPGDPTYQFVRPGISIRQRAAAPLSCGLEAARPSSPDVAGGPDQLSCYPQLMGGLRVLAEQGLATHAIADPLAIRLMRRSPGSTVLGACAKR